MLDKALEKELKNLEEKYYDDKDALELISDVREDMAYLKKKQEEGNYSGQTPEQALLELKDHLAYWH